jgi:hypothetical protein
LIATNSSFLFIGFSPSSAPTRAQALCRSAFSCHSREGGNPKAYTKLNAIRGKKQLLPFISCVCGNLGKMDSRLRGND